MDFTCIVLFLALYYLKPQEWTSVFATLHFVQFIMIASLGTLLFRERKLNLKDFFRTPHDWAIYAFILWIVLTSATPWATFKDISNRLIFYICILQTLTNWDRTRRYLGWWAGMIVTVAFLALAGEYFWDPLGSNDITHGIMKDRLILNISTVNNPNALGHSLAPAIAILYYICIWKKPAFIKLIGILAIAICTWAIFLTVSKGSYLVTGIAILGTLTFGRPKIAQIIIAAALIAIGTSSLYLLPRMAELHKTKTDPAIQGRIKAFTYGRGYYLTLGHGVGYMEFMNRILHDHHYKKAAHSTYVQIGTELGRPGMGLMLLILWCNLRTIMFAKTYTVEQERIRRILFVLVLAYCISGWMVDFGYRPTFFMFTAAVAAFHRNLYKLGQEPIEEEPDPMLPAWRARLLAAPAPADIPATVVMQMLPQPAHAPALTAANLAETAPWRTRAQQEADDIEPGVPEYFWNRIGILDILVVIAWVALNEKIWSYIILNV